MQRLLKDFFCRDVLVVAPQILGQHLVRRYPSGLIEKYIVTEVEAYKGGEDLACHASKGKTARTEIMFSEGGYAYVYLVYGMHWMLNVVTGSENQPQAVLIRGVKGCNGPGRLTRMLEVDRSFYGEDYTESTRIWFEPTEFTPSINKGPRIGVDYAGNYWASIPWRFWIDLD
jgi:DNA-3-methyladenine glycosylase